MLIRIDLVIWNLYSKGKVALKMCSLFKSYATPSIIDKFNYIYND